MLLFGARQELFLPLLLLFVFSTLWNMVWLYMVEVILKCAVQMYSRFHYTNLFCCSFCFGVHHFSGHKFVNSNNMLTVYLIIEMHSRDFSIFIITRNKCLCKRFFAHASSSVSFSLSTAALWVNVRMSERAHNAAMFSKYNVYRVPCLSKCKYMAISQIIEQNSKLDGGWCLMKGQGKLLQFIPMNGH